MLLLFAGRLGLGSWPAWSVTLLALAFSTPHYGATLLRVYERPEDRRKYAFFTVWLTLFMVLCFGAGLYDAVFGSWLLTLYVCWSPWHFAGQNFGVAVMSLRRRGVAVDGTARRLLHGSFVLAFGLSLLAIHTAGSDLVFAQGTGSESVYSVARLGIPVAAAVWLGGVLGIAYLAATIGALVRLSRGGHTRQLGPTVLLLATHSLWFVLPATMTFRAGGLPPLVFAAIWISTAHSVQYLWITTYYARRTGSVGRTGFFVRCLLSGAALALLPPIVFAPGLLGRFAPYAAEVTVLSFAVVNLHHFILDGAIWKLRDGRVARALLDERGAEEETAPATRRPAFLRPVVYALGALALAMPFYLIVEVSSALGATTREQAEGVAKRLALLGKESPDVYHVVGLHRLRERDFSAAEQAFRRSLELDPHHAKSALRLSDLLLRENRQPAEALEWAQLASRASGHTDPAALIVLGRANAAAGRPAAARRSLQRAYAMAIAAGEPRLAEISQQRLEALSAESPAEGAAPPGRLGSGS